MDHDYLRAGTTETHMGPSPHIRSISSDALSRSLSSPQHAAASTRQSQGNSGRPMCGASLHLAAYCLAINSGFSWWQGQSVCWKAISSPLLAVESLSPAAQGSPYSITKLLWFCDGEVKENDKSLGMVVEFINSINDTFLWGNLRAQPDRGEKRLLGVLWEQITQDGSAVKRVAFTCCFIIAHLRHAVHFVLCAWFNNCIKYGKVSEQNTFFTILIFLGKSWIV